MFCYNCGKEIDDKAVVCVGCGVPTGKQNVASNASNISNANANTNTSIAHESSGMKGYDIAVMVLSIIALAMAGLCFLLSVISIYSFWIPLGCGVTAYIVAKVNKSQFTKLGLTAMVFGIVVAAMVVFFLILSLSVLSSIPGNIYG